MKTLSIDIAHGVSLKGTALVSRVLFLLLIVPLLPAGVLSTYVFLATLSQIFCRVVGLGLEEQIPLRVAGEADRAVGFAKLSELFFVAAIVIAVVAIASGSTSMHVLLLTICYVNTLFMSGFLRTLRLRGSERLRDLNWVLFLGFAALPLLQTANGLIIAMSLALLSVQALEIVINRRSGIGGGGTVAIAAKYLASMTPRSWRKLIAIVLLILATRALVLWPEWLSLAVPLDDIAFALLIGEAIWQTAMVIVYQRHAVYCRRAAQAPRAMLKDVVLFGLSLYAYLAVMAILVFQLEHWSVQVSGFERWDLAGFFILYFAGLTGYALARYFVWALRDFDWRLLGLKLALVAGQGVVVAASPLDWWPALAAAGSLVAALVALLVATQVAWRADDGVDAVVSTSKTGF